MKRPLSIAPRSTGAMFLIVDANGEDFARLPKTHKIEAEGVVRAYNAHEALVAALRSARNHLYNTVPYFPNGSDALDVAEEIADALKLAGVTP